ncbi:MAG: hypothetical protein HZA49_00440 [Planctomycetes bacterium]|nr:hypothetical protein [Planctomycetota bacterium]
MDDLIQLGAYVVIILVIGGASVIKKIIEAQKRRKEAEQSQVKTLRLEPTYSREPRQPSAPETEEPDSEIVLESESASESGQKPRIEDILKEVFNIPTMTQKRDTVIKSITRKQKGIQQPVEKPQLVSAAVEEPVPTPAETVTASAEPSWEVFATGLKNRGLTEIQQAVVMSELIQKPRARRMGR